MLHELSRTALQSGCERREMWTVLSKAKDWCVVWPGMSDKGDKMWRKKKPQSQRGLFVDLSKYPSNPPVSLHISVQWPKIPRLQIYTVQMWTCSLRLRAHACMCTHLLISSQMYKAAGLHRSTGDLRLSKCRVLACKYYFWTTWHFLSSFQKGDRIKVWLEEGLDFVSHSVFFPLSLDSLVSPSGELMQSTCSFYRKAD